MSKHYIGDEVYAEFVGDNLVLTTEKEGEKEPSNTIVLEPGLFTALAQVYEQHCRKFFDEKLKEEK